MKTEEEQVREDLEIQKTLVVKLSEKIDLMADEFERIAATPDVSDEVKFICQRSAQDIKQTVPLVRQRDFAMKRLREVESEKEMLIEKIEKAFHKSCALDKMISLIGIKSDSLACFLNPNKEYEE